MRRWMLGLLVGAGFVVGTNDGFGQQTASPDFCRSGAGHPVHGRVWCVQRGYSLESGTVWDKAEWADVVLRAPRRAGVIPGASLPDVVGDDIVAKLEDQRRRIEAYTPLAARWLPAEGEGVVLQVFSGRTVIAELLDSDGNGRVDLVLLNAGLRQENPKKAD